MARRKRNVKRMNLTMPEEILAGIDLWLTNPSTGKLRYGAFSSITAQLWMQFLRELENPENDPVEYLRRYGVDIEDVGESESSDNEEEQEESE